jgi:hypothetical protein
MRKASGTVPGQAQCRQAAFLVPFLLKARIAGWGKCSGNKLPEWAECPENRGFTVA